MTKYKGLVKSGADLNGKLLDSVITDMTRYLAKGKLQQAHRQYLRRMLAHFDKDKEYSWIREIAIKQVCADLTHEVKRLSAENELYQGIKTNILLMLIRDMKEYLLAQLPELLEDYNFLTVEEVLAL